MIPASEPQSFGEWLPDLGEFANPGATVALNVTSQAGLYRPFPNPVVFSAALPAACKGAFAYRDTVGNSTVFAGTKTRLYKLNGTTWTDVTRGIATTAVPYTMSDENFWDFVNFGDLIIATNYVDDIQVYDMGSATEFSRLSASAPRCRRMFIHKNFLVCVDTVDSDGDKGIRVRWSPIGNPAGNWAVDPTGTQADFQDLLGGDFQNSFGADLEDFAVIVQGRAIWRMDYVGGDTIFNFNPVDTGRGSIYPRACIANGRSAYFLGEDGFYEFSGGGLEAIGYNKVDKYFFSIFDETYSYNINTAIDPLKKNVLWAFPSTGVAGYTDKILCFNWADRRWSLINDESELIFQFFSIGYNLDNVDSLFPSIEDAPYSVDSRFWTGGKTLLGTFSREHKLGTLNGTPKTAVIASTEIRPNISGCSTLHSLIPYITGGTIRARIGYRNIANLDVTYTDYVSQNPATGELDFLHDAVLFRCEFEISGAWSVATAVSYRARPSGNY